MGFAQAVLLLRFMFVLAVRQCFKTRAKPSQSSSCQRAVVSRTVVTDESGPRSRASLDCDSLTKVRVLLGENWLFSVLPSTFLAAGPSHRVHSLGAGLHQGTVAMSACPGMPGAVSSPCQSWQTIIYAFRYC